MSENFFEVEEIEAPAGKQTVKTLLVKINRPPMNALSSEVLDQLNNLIDEIGERAHSAVIFTGEGKAFIAGADIAQMKEMTPAEAKAFSEKGQATFSKLESAPFVSIAAINGYALGGGLEFALACNIRIAADSAMLGLPEVTLGLIPGFGGTQRIARLAGTGTAALVALTGSMIGAEDALRLNILQKTTSTEQLLEEAKKIAGQIETVGPNAVREAKKLIYKNVGHHSDKDFQAEADTFGSLFEKEEPREGLSAFLEKRKPNF